MNHIWNQQDTKWTTWRYHNQKSWKEQHEVNEEYKHDMKKTEAAYDMNPTKQTKLKRPMYVSSHSFSYMLFLGWHLGFMWRVSRTGLPFTGKLGCFTIFLEGASLQAKFLWHFLLWANKVSSVYVVKLWLSRTMGSKKERRKEWKKCWKRWKKAAQGTWRGRISTRRRALHSLISRWHPRLCDAAIFGTAGWCAQFDGYRLSCQIALPPKCVDKSWQVFSTFVVCFWRRALWGSGHHAREGHFQYKVHAPWACGCSPALFFFEPGSRRWDEVRPREVGETLVVGVTSARTSKD